MKKSEIRNPSLFNSNEGFSFIELLVVVVLIGIVGVITSQIFILNFRSQGKSEIIKEVKQSGDYTLSTLESMVRNAKDIDQTSCNENTQTFSIINSDGYSTTFDCSDGTKIASISADTNGVQPTTSQPLTSDRVHVATCTFRIVCPTPPLSPKYVFIDFTLTQANDSATVNENSSLEFQTTVGLRNYE